MCCACVFVCVCVCVCVCEMIDMISVSLPLRSLQVDSLLFQPLRKTASMTIEAMKSTTSPLQPGVSNGSPKSSPQLRKQTSDVRPPQEEVSGTSSIVISFAQDC